MNKLSRSLITASVTLALAITSATAATAAPALPSVSPSSLTNLSVDPSARTNLTPITVTVPMDNALFGARIDFVGATWTGLQSFVQNSAFATTSTPAVCGGASTLKIGTQNAGTGYCSVQNWTPTSARSDYEKGSTNPGTITFEVPAGALTFSSTVPTGGFRLDVTWLDGTQTPPVAESFEITFPGSDAGGATGGDSGGSEVTPPATGAASPELAQTGSEAPSFSGGFAVLLLGAALVTMTVLRRRRA